MVDCRLCENAYKIWHDEFDSPEDVKYKLVCMAKEVFIDKKYISEGPCDLYVDVDGDVSGDGDL